MRKYCQFVRQCTIPARTPISMKTSVPHELMGPKARLWVSSPMRASSCSSEQDSLSCPRKSTALLQPPGTGTAWGGENERRLLQLQLTWCSCVFLWRLTWTQRHWTNSSLWFWPRTQCIPATPGCWSRAGSDSAWWSLTRWWTAQPAGMERGGMTQTYNRFVTQKARVLVKFHRLDLF